MASGRALTTLGIFVAVAAWLVACGDAEWPGPKSKAPPLNAGPGTMGLSGAPAESEDESLPSSGGASILGDWFFCTADGGDPCSQVLSMGFRLRGDGKAVELRMGEKLFGVADFPSPYCAFDSESDYSVVGDTLTLSNKDEGKTVMIFKVQGDRASVKIVNGKGPKMTAIRVNPPASTGLCDDGTEVEPG